MYAERHKKKWKNNEQRATQHQCDAPANENEIILIA